MEIPAALLTVALFLAVAIERAVEAFVAPLLPEQYSIAKRYVALGLGLAATFGFGVDLIAPALYALGITPVVAWAGKILTGVAIGGGSNFLHDLWPGK